MGQKVNPIGLRLGINRTWESRWYSQKDFAKYLNEDIAIRSFVRGKYHDAGISKVEIERAAKLVSVKIFSSKPGRLIGRQGKGVDVLREDISRFVDSSGRSVKVDVFEVKSPDSVAQLCADGVASQLEKRVSFRRAMRKVMQQAMKAGVKGVKIRVSGRLNGAELARTEWYMEGRIPLHTLRADIDYALSEAKTTYGIIGCKVWLFKGEVFGKSVSSDGAPRKQARTKVEE